MVLVIQCEQMCVPCSLRILLVLWYALLISISMYMTSERVSERLSVSIYLSDRESGVFEGLVSGGELLCICVFVLRVCVLLQAHEQT
jgi:hypothetical protein